MKVLCWIPESPIAVLGCSNKAETELHHDQCIKDMVPVLKRYGGGGTVILYPGCLVVSCGLWVDHPYQNDQYFKLLNSAVVACLTDFDPIFEGLGQKGISDITWENSKVAGTSMFRSRNYLLYQASLLLNLDFDLIDKYLKHPSREPSYRQGRSHREFLQGLGQIAAIDPKKLTVHMESRLGLFVEEKFGGRLIPPQEDQFKNIEARLKREQNEPLGFH